MIPVIQQGLDIIVRFLSGSYMEKPYFEIGLFLVDFKLELKSNGNFVIYVFRKPIFLEEL